MTDRFHPPPRYKPRGWGDELRRRLHNAGLSAWELADLLGVHEGAITMDALPNQPLHVVLELARRLDLHPADLTPYAEAVYQLPRHTDTEHPPQDPGTDADAAAVLNALAHAGRPLTADYLAESLRWTYDRTADALAHAWAHPELGGPYALRRAAPHHFTLSPRNDVLTDRQMDWLHPADHDRSWRTPRRPPDRDVLTDLDATVLFHAHHAGSVSPYDRDTPEWATAIAGLIDSGLLVPTEGDTAVLAPDVQYGLRLLDSDETTTY
ncbi:helix-turn-helix transcriptional regulator [Streptomyces sp. NBC_01506]|uniref:helix-turn-helix domain-containing protein n=1 Tax=Streptomyces sp. NBC_01506 TaxID=2903887 RepID=UPI002F90EF2B